MTQRYKEYMHLKEHGQWYNGVPDWAKDYDGKMNDLIAANAVIEELSSLVKLQNYSDDAEKWGNALNAASWSFHDKYHETLGIMPANLFNNVKPMIREAILTYIKEIEKTT